MQQLKDGGPAFPCQMLGSDGRPVADLSPGMSIRDYFASHAPIEVPSWFEHVREPQNFPPMPEVEELDETHRKLAADWRRDPCFDLPDEIAWWGKKVQANRIAVAAWHDGDYSARFVQWRWKYADMMLGVRGIG